MQNPRPSTTNTQGQQFPNRNLQLHMISDIPHSKMTTHINIHRHTYTYCVYIYIHKQNNNDLYCMVSIYTLMYIMLYYVIFSTQKGVPLHHSWFPICTARLFRRENSTAPCSGEKPKPLRGGFGSQRAANIVESVGESAQEATSLTWSWCPRSFTKLLQITRNWKLWVYKIYIYNNLFSAALSNLANSLSSLLHTMQTVSRCSLNAENMMVYCLG